MKGPHIFSDQGPVESKSSPAVKRAVVSQSVDKLIRNLRDGVFRSSDI